MSQIENRNQGGTIPYGNVLLSFRTEDDVCKTVGVATEEIPQGRSREEIKVGDYVQFTGKRGDMNHPWCPFRSARPGAVVRVSNVSATGESIFYKTRFSPGKKWVISRDQVEKIDPRTRSSWWNILGYVRKGDGIAPGKTPKEGNREEIKAGDYVRLIGNRFLSPNPWCFLLAARRGTVVRVCRVNESIDRVFYRDHIPPRGEWAVSMDEVEKIAPPRRLPWWNILGFASFLASFFYISWFLRSHSDLTLPHFPGGTIMHDVIMNLTNEPFVQQAVVRLSGGIAYALEAMVILLTLSMYGKRLARGLEWRRKRAWEKESRLWATREHCDERRKKEEEEEKKERRECQDRKAAEESSRRAQEASVIAQAVQAALVSSSCHPVTNWKVWSQPAEIPHPGFREGRFVKFIRDHDTIIQRYSSGQYITENIVAGDCVRIHSLDDQNNRFTYDPGPGHNTMQTAPLDAVVPV